jgi:hypothetical protein
VQGDFNFSGEQPCEGTRYRLISISAVCVERLRLGNGDHDGARAHRLVQRPPSRPRCGGSTGNAKSCWRSAAPGHISIRDVNDEREALVAYGDSLDNVRRQLYATDKSGRLIVDADVIIAIWLIRLGEGWLASLFGKRGDAAGLALWL